MTNEEIFEKAIRYMCNSRKGRINLYRTELSLGLTHAEKTAFVLWLKKNHPDALHKNPPLVGKSIDGAMYLPGIFQIVCVPTNRRLIGSSVNSVIHTKNVYLSYIRTIDTFHKQNLWQRCPQAIEDIKRYGADAFRFELIKTLPADMDRKDVAAERQKIIDMYLPEYLYHPDLKQMKKAKLQNVLESNFDVEAKEIAAKITVLTKLKSIYEQDLVELFQQRLDLDVQQKAAPKQSRGKFNAAIREVNRQKKATKVELEKTKKELTILSKDLNRQIFQHEIKTLRPVGRPVEK